MLDDGQINRWFQREVLPLERLLQMYIKRHWSKLEDIVEIRQDVYEKILIGVKNSGIPLNTKAYMFTIARNHIINCKKRERIVYFEMFSEEDYAAREFEDSAERHILARDELRHAKAGIEKLPPRCREVLRLRRLEGYSTKEVSEILGVTTDTVSQQLKYGMKALIDHMLGGTGKIVRNRAVPGRRSQEDQL